MRSSLLSKAQNADVHRIPGHFGVNNFYADNGLEDAYTTKLYFPADPDQMTAV